MKPKFKRKYYYKECVTQKKSVIMNKKYHCLMVLYLSLVRGQYLYREAKPRSTAF